METIIDGAILLDFFENQPERIPIGTEEENQLWNSFWSFLKSKTNLDVRNYDPSNIFQEAFFKSLTTGRGNSKITVSNTSPIHNEGVIESKKPSSFYCLNEEGEDDVKLLEEKSGFVVAFQKTYKKHWAQLNLLNLDTSLSVRKDAYIKTNEFSSWSQLSNYLSKFTDVVMVDNYIFSSNELIPSNFEKILIELSKATPVRFNLTIYTFEGMEKRKDGQVTELKINGKSLMRQINSIVEENKINCNIQLIIANNRVKEHDRGIFTNYLRIKSGDSFNYFNSKNEVITKGTDIDFVSLTEPNARHAAKNVLEKLNQNIKQLKSVNRLIPNIYGECDNLLLSQFD